jgi:hypothetical protein
VSNACDPVRGDRRRGSGSGIEFRTTELTKSTRKRPKYIIYSDVTCLPCVVCQTGLLVVTPKRARNLLAGDKGVFRSMDSSDAYIKVNIQGIFGERSVRVERTPVSLRFNRKKQLKKVPRLTQNTTCKHEYLGRELTRPNDVSQE